MPLRKFIVRYDDPAHGTFDAQDMGLGPLGYVYEYDDAYRRARELARQGASNVRVVKRVAGADDEVVAAIEA